MLSNLGNVSNDDWLVRMGDEFPISREMVSKSPPNIEVYGIGFTAHFLECDDGWFQRYCTFLSICGDGNAKA